MRYIKSYESIIKNIGNVSIILGEVTPIAIYNADKKELIGIFKTQKMANRYVSDSKIPDTTFLDKVKKKILILIKDNLLKCNIAVRYASSEQKKLLGDKKWIVMKEYPQPLWIK